MKAKPKRGGRRSLRQALGLGRDFDYESAQSVLACAHALARLDLRLLDPATRCAARLILIADQDAFRLELEAWQSMRSRTLAAQVLGVVEHDAERGVTRIHGHAQILLLPVLMSLYLVLIVLVSVGYWAPALSALIVVPILLMIGLMMRSVVRARDRLYDLIPDTLHPI